MRKVILGFAAAALVLSCKKVPKGGNSGVLKMEEGVERYDSHEVRGGEHAGTATAHGAEKKSVEVDVNGTKLKAYEGGLEQKLVSYLSTDAYKNAADDAALKDTWYNFDNVNFKMGSTNQLEAGSAE